MNDIKRIAAVHDISGFGKCALTVALPVISATGVECACIPTALLSTHTGGFSDYVFHDMGEFMLPIARHWKAEGLHFDGIYSGYLASAAQERELEEIIQLLGDGDTQIIVDPVMADNGRYYSKFGDEMRDAFRRLVGKADLITPNITEAALLAGMEYRAGVHDEDYMKRLLDRLSGLCGGIIAITGVWPDTDHVGVYAADLKTGERGLFARPRREGIFCGTGDIFASAFSALMLRGASLENAAEAAVALVAESIDRTVRRETPRRNGVDFENALPNYIRQVSALFRE